MGKLVENKTKYVVWINYGFTVQADRPLDLDNTEDYYELKELATKRLGEIGLQTLVLDADVEADLDWEA